MRAGAARTDKAESRATAEYLDNMVVNDYRCLAGRGIVVDVDVVGCKRVSSCK